MNKFTIVFSLVTLGLLAGCGATADQKEMEDTSVPDAAVTDTTQSGAMMKQEEDSEMKQDDAATEDTNGAGMMDDGKNQ